jgi:hypothetical protein
MIKKSILLFFHILLTFLLIYYIGDFASKNDDLLLTGVAISLLMFLWIFLVIHIGKFVFYLITNIIKNND